MTAWRVPYPKFGGPNGLRRTSKIARALGLDLGAFGARGAVITGSNGKGSTAAMAAAALQAARTRVGLFTSPHLLALNERFRVDGVDIADDALGRHWRRVSEAVRAAGEEANVGGFEFLFLIAADWFAAQGCDATVWEAGIGGRFDVTRLVAPRRTALVSLDLEHTALLGDTLEAIARDKLDAAPDGARVFVGQSCQNERRVIEAHCAGRGLRPRFVAPLSHAPLSGAHQRENAALALALAVDIVGPHEALGEGLGGVRWPGRLEVLQRAPLVVIDVGHTPAAAKAAREGFQSLAHGRPLTLILGLSQDKPAEAMVAALAPGFERIVCTIARHRGAPADLLASLAAKAHPAAKISTAEDVAAARDAALAVTSAEAAVLVAGGLFVAAEFKALHLGLDPAELAFF